MIKVVFVDIKDFEVDFLSNNKPENCEFVFIHQSLQENFEHIADKIKDAEILSVFTSSGVSAEYLSQFTNLKLIATRSTGYNRIDLEYCKNHNITVVNVPKYGDCTVAEFAFGLMLNVIRKINIAYENLKNGIVNVQGYVGNDLKIKPLELLAQGL